MNEAGQIGSCWRLRTAQLGVLVSCLPILGWATGTPWLVRASATHAAIVPTTALGFCLLFLSAALIEAGRREQLQARLILAAAGLVIADRLYPDLQALPAMLGMARDAPAPGDAMSLPTAIGLMLGVLVLWRLRRDRNSTGALILTLLGLSTSVAILLGHSFDPGSIYALPVFATMSEYTIGLFVLFFTTLLLPQRESALSPPV